MAKDLVKIVQDTEISLSSSPSQYTTQLELFTSADEKILSEFLIQIRSAKPHYLRFKDWEALVGNTKSYTKPKKDIEDKRKEFLKLEQVCRSMDYNTFLECGVSMESIRVFGDFPTMLYRVLEMRTKLYESIIAYAKYIGSEKDMDPINVVRSPELRDDIYKMIFPARENFEWYNNTSIQIAHIMTKAVYEMCEKVEDEIKEVDETHPLISRCACWFAKRKVLKAIEQLPPKQVTESFLREEFNYQRMMTDRIYGHALDNQDVIDAEIIE